MKDKIKCAFCEYRTPRFTTGKDGKVRPGWNRLRNHIETEHPYQYMEVQEKIMKEYGEMEA